MHASRVWSRANLEIGPTIGGTRFHVHTVTQKPNGRYQKVGRNTKMSIGETTPSLSSGRIQPHLREAHAQLETNSSHDCAHFFTKLALAHCLSLAFFSQVPESSSLKHSFSSGAGVGEGVCSAA